MKHIIMLLLLVISLAGFSQEKKTKSKSMKIYKKEAPCEDGCEKKLIVCKLTSPEMQKRKATVIASLKMKVLGKKELSNGFSYEFKGSDNVIDELTTFVKTERLC